MVGYKGREEKEDSNKMHFLSIFIFSCFQIRLFLLIDGI